MPRLFGSADDLGPPMCPRWQFRSPTISSGEDVDVAEIVWSIVVRYSL